MGVSREDKRQIALNLCPLILFFIPIPDPDKFDFGNTARFLKLAEAVQKQAKALDAKKDDYKNKLSKVKPLIPLKYNPDTYLPFGVPGLGLLIVILFLALVGWVTAGFLGRFTVRSGERIMARMPVIRSIYGAAKQIVETVLSQQSTAFREVVMFEYPRPGIWTIGFITGEPGRIIQDHVEDEVVNILLPTTPNPTSGFLLFLPRKSIQVLDMSIEEGMKMVISVGIVSPDDDRIKGTKTTPKFSTARPPIYARAEKPGS